MARSLGASARLDRVRVASDHGTFGALAVVLAVALPFSPVAGAKTSPTVGTKIKVANGSVTFSAYEQPVSADNTGKDPADAGNEYAAVEVEACSTAKKKQQVTRSCSCSCFPTAARRTPPSP
jgi:hypothetical protein